MDQFLGSSFRGLAQGSLYALLGLGFVIIYKSTRVVNFAQPALMIFGAYWTSYMVVVLGLGFWIGLALAVLLTALIGAAVERIALRPMVGEPVFSATMVTVGVFIVLQVIAGDLIGLELRQVGHPWGLERTEVAGVVVFHSDLAKLAVTATVVALLWLFLRHSRLGLAMRATAASQETALALGVPAGRMFGLAWAISGALAAVAGMLVATGGGGLRPGPPPPPPPPP